MRVLLHGEGPTDYGVSDGYGGWCEGPLLIIMQRIFGSLEIECIDKAEMKKRPRVQRSIIGLSGHGVIAALLAIVAKERGFDVAALYRDADRESGMDSRQDLVCKKRYKKIKSDICKGFEQSRSDLMYIAIIPMKMIECWLLSDPNCFVLVYGGYAPDLPNKPELIWGDKQYPGSNYPKYLLGRVISSYGDSAGRISYIKLAETVDITALNAKCPISFKDFFEQMNALIYAAPRNGLQ